MRVIRFGITKSASVICFLSCLLQINLTFSRFIMWVIFALNQIVYAIRYFIFIRFNSMSLKLVLAVQEMYGVHGLSLYWKICQSFWRHTTNIIYKHFIICSEDNRVVRIFIVHGTNGDFLILFAGKVITVKHTAVTKKKDSMRAMALDSENNQIQVKDIVKVIDGPHSVGSHVDELPFALRYVLQLGARSIG